MIRCLYKIYGADDNMGVPIATKLHEVEDFFESLYYAMESAMDMIMDNKNYVRMIKDCPSILRKYPDSGSMFFDDPTNWERKTADSYYRSLWPLSIYLYIKEEVK